MRERGRNRGEKRALEPHFPSCSLSFSSGLEPLVGGKGRFLEKFLESTAPPPINQRPHPLFLSKVGREQRSEGEKKARGNMVKGEDEKEGTLETAVGEVS